jgi:hypothetical protein
MSTGRSLAHAYEKEADMLVDEAMSCLDGAGEPQRRLVSDVLCDVMRDLLRRHAAHRLRLQGLYSDMYERRSTRLSRLMAQCRAIERDCDLRYGRLWKIIETGFVRLDDPVVKLRRGAFMIFGKVYKYNYKSVRYRNLSQR